MNPIIPLKPESNRIGILTCELIYGLRKPDTEAQMNIGMPWVEFTNLDDDQQKVIKRRIANFWTQSFLSLWGPDSIAVNILGTWSPRWRQLEKWISAVYLDGDQEVPREWMSKNTEVLKIPDWLVACAA
jgi:hypothetical protein